VQDSVVVVGLGPGDERLLTQSARMALDAPGPVFLRTSEHPVAATLASRPGVRTFDHLYRSSSSFEEVYSEIARAVVAAAKAAGRVIYAVPGDPTMGEASVQAVRSLARTESVAVRVIPGVSFLEPTLAAVGWDALDGLVVVDALDLGSRRVPSFPPDVPAVVAQLHSQLLASDVKLTLLSRYPPEHEVAIVRGAGTPAEEVWWGHLYEMDRQAVWDDRTTLCVPRLPAPASLESLSEVVARLRAPDGCPWDREQTHTSLRRFLLEETYEALRALDRGDLDSLREELGDLLLQILLHAEIATESGEFLLTDVLGRAQEKIVRRHPHVFAGVRVAGVEEVLHNWEAAKAREREHTGGSALDGVAGELPALGQSLEIQERAARVGFDWGDVKGVLAKIPEEIRELAQAAEGAAREAEFGDLLFSLVNVARWMGVDPEAALRTSSDRFRRRFHHMERAARQVGDRLAQLSPEEMDRLWRAAKAAEA
jgi:tetrapyrrole methylase family protein/MazG family protein